MLNLSEKEKYNMKKVPLFLLIGVLAFSCGRKKGQQEN